MATTTINIQELLFLLDHTPADQNIMLTGHHGIGKSEILTGYFSEKGLPVTALFLGQMADPGDLIGLPDKTGEKTNFLPPYWFPTDGKPIVLFLDELNRARPEILQGVMDLALNKKLAGHYLPKGSRIIAAVNEGDEYQLTELDPALVSRFNIYRFEPTVEEWLAWAQKNELDRRVISFIRKNPGWLENSNGMDGDLSKTPDRRAWKRVSDIIKSINNLDSRCFKLIAGVIGGEATSRFIAEQAKKMDAADFLMNFEQRKSVLSDYHTHDFAALNDEIFKCLEVAKGRDTLPLIKGLKSYTNYLDSHNCREAFAHFAYSYGEAKVAKAFIDGNCPDIVRKVRNYQKAI